jgi:non-homologous end joining protein Ku
MVRIVRAVLLINTRVAFCVNCRQAGLSVAKLSHPDNVRTTTAVFPEAESSPEEGDSMLPGNAGIYLQLR